ncbi:hypothetical protein Tco_0405434, partial [Tanacetum coccineum]
MYPTAIPPQRTVNERRTRDEIHDPVNHRLKVLLYQHYHRTTRVERMQTPIGSWACVKAGKTPTVNSGSYVNVVIGGNGPKISSLPALVLDETCLVDRNLSFNVMGKVKDFNSIPNLYGILSYEGFSRTKITYLGGLWVMMDLDNEDIKKQMMSHTGLNSWFSVLQDAVDDFVIDERLVWVDIEGVPLKA